MATLAPQTDLFVPDPNKRVVPFMRDVFTVPRGAREKPRLIGSVCTECEEYFFPKTGVKATCDNPFCPRSTKETLLSGRGKLLSATVTRSSAEDEERTSAVILLEEGIKINSHLVGWEGFRDLLVPGTPAELVLQEIEENEEGATVVGYAFKLVTGRRKPKFPEPEEKDSKGAESAKMGLSKAQERKAERAKARAAEKKLAAKEAAERRAKALAQKKAAAKEAAAAKKAKALAQKVAAAKKAASRKAKALARKKALQKKKDAKRRAAKKKAANRQLPKAARGKTRGRPGLSKGKARKSVKKSAARKKPAKKTSKSSARKKAEIKSLKRSSR